LSQVIGLLGWQIERPKAQDNTEKRRQFSVSPAASESTKAILSSQRRFENGATRLSKNAISQITLSCAVVSAAMAYTRRGNKILLAINFDTRWNLIVFTFTFQHLYSQKTGWVRHLV
jgi:hypothetical protein